MPHARFVECAAAILGSRKEDICRAAGIPLLLSSSIKAGLDINWSDPEDKDEAIEVLARQVTSLHAWTEKNQLSLEEPLRPYIEALVQVRKQDLEETAAGRVLIRQGVAEDRRVSIEDPEMRHGRKSKSKRFNGYKEHVATDLDTDLIVACAVTPANRPEEEATPQLHADMKQQGIEIGELAIDRAYVNSSLAADVLASGGEVVAKPWKAQNRPNLFTKADFRLNLRDKTIRCPAGQVENFEAGDVVEFDPEVCGNCPLRSRCTHSASGGRTVQIAEDEQLQQRLRKLQSSKSGRARLRERTGVEHRLAHIAARKGPTARYRSTRKNLYDLRRAAAVQNLETIHRVQRAAA